MIRGKQGKIEGRGLEMANLGRKMVRLFEG